jgi:septation ring formation regulator EzrA
MDISPTFILTAALAVLGGLAWLIRLESKTNGVIEDVKDLFAHADDRSIHHGADYLDSKFEAVEKRLDRIDDRLDRSLAK